MPENIPGMSETSIRRFKEPNWSPSKEISLYINSKPAQHQRQMVLNETRAWWRRREGIPSIKQQADILFLNSFSETKANGKIHSVR